MAASSMKTRDTSSAVTDDRLNCAVCQDELRDDEVIAVGGFPTCKPCLERVAAEVGIKSPRFAKAKDDKWIAGVCGGLADAANMDRDTFRVLMAVAIFATGVVPGIFAYVALAFFLPVKS